MDTPGHRIILHFDLDAFFAAVEVLLEPSLAGKPVIVGGDPRQRGVVSTASYEARAFGVHSAMPAALAQRLCPEGVFLRPRHGVYREFSRRVFAIVGRFAEAVQPVSIDEAYVDLDKLDPVATAQDIKRAIRAETGLTASMGLASSKLVSKIASDYGKPDGFVVIAEGDEAGFLAPLPVRKLLGVGPKSAERLEGLGIMTIGDLAVADLPALAGAFGVNQAKGLRCRAQGLDDSPLEIDREIKSISDETTFAHDLTDARELWRVLGVQSDSCARRLAEGQLLARTISVKLRYADFRTVTRSVTLAVPTSDGETIRLVVAGLMRQAWAVERRPLRLTGVRVSGLVAEPTLRQLPLFP
ncbi:MAG: DNA polymerase IV [Chloroflexota bacterium]